MIKLTLREAIEVTKALRVLPNIRGGAGFALSRVRIALKPELEAYDEQEHGLIAAHGGTVKEDGRSIAWPPPKDGETPADVAFVQAREQLLDTEIEIDREPVKIAAVLGADPGKQPDIAPELFTILEKIIVE